MDLLTQIESDIASRQPLADLLRQCVLFGGRTGSTDLRAWATQELRGYDGEADVPTYRTVGAGIYVNAQIGNSTVTGQRLGLHELPGYVSDAGVDESITLRQGVGELEALTRSVGTEGESVKLQIPGSPMLAAIMDKESGQPFQKITAIYWAIHVATLLGVLDQIRTSLADLVAELRTVTPEGNIPSSTEVGHAVNIAVHGNVTRLEVAAATPGKATATTTGSPPESAGGWWTVWRTAAAVIVGLFTIVGGVFAYLQWLTVR